MTWFLLGVIVGIIIGVLIDRDTVYKYANKIRKVKIKKSHDISDVIDINQKIDDISLSRKELKQRKRQIRRENRSKANSNE